MLTLALHALLACAGHAPRDATAVVDHSAPPLAPLPVDDLLIPQQACGTPSKAEVSHPELRSDLELLELLLRQGYAGLEPTAATGLDWDGLFASMHADLDDLPDPVSVARVQDWAIRYLEPTGDNHLSLWRVSEEGWWVTRAAGRHLDAWVAELELSRDHEGAWRSEEHDEQLLGCEGWELQELLQPVLAHDDPVYLRHRPLLLSVADPPPLSCSFAGQDEPRSLPLRRLRGFAQRPPREPAWEQLRDGPVLTQRIANLSVQHQPELQHWVESAQAMREAPAVLLDVRGNAGGADTLVMRLFSQLSDAPLRYDDVDRLDSTAATIAQANWYACQLARDGLDPELSAQWTRKREQIQAELQDWRDEGAPPWRTWHHHEVTTEGQAPEPWSGRMVVLMDHDCASSCETVPLLARQLPGTLLLGENSGGVGTFGEVKRFRLPNTGLGIGMGSKHFHHPDPALAAPEGVGHLPDVWLDVADPMAAASAVADCLTEQMCAAVYDAELTGLATATRGVAIYQPDIPTPQPTVDPASVGADPAVLARILERTVASRSDALVILVDGQPLVSWPDEQQPIETMSATKSILSLAIGMLVEQGAIASVDAPASTWFPAWAHGDKAQVTVRHLLEHSSGLEAPSSKQIYTSGDLLGFALRSPLVSAPGEVFQYNNNAANLLAGIATAAAGEPVDAFVGRELLAPVGITDWHWAHDPVDNVQGGAGLALRAEDLARIGTLMLDEGSWDGQQLVDPEWIASSTQLGPVHPACGRLWWMLEDDDDAIVGYRADGWLGQMLVVIPQTRVVVVRQMRSRPEHWSYGDEGVDTMRDLLRLATQLVPATSEELPQ